MENGWKKLKQKFDENPVQFIVIASIAATAAAHLINAVSAAEGRRAYAKHANLRARGL